MATLKTFCWVIFCLFIVALGVLFSLHNKIQVPVDLLVFSVPPLPVSLVIFVSMAFGVLLGLMVSTLMIMRLRATNYRIQRQLHKMVSEKALGDVAKHPSQDQVVAVFQ